MSDDTGDIPRKKVTYYLKDALECPVCDTEFRKEEILSGGGRMSAGTLTNELHRNYEPTVKFGEVHPLIYPIAVCPTCYNAAHLKDFGSNKCNLDKLVKTRNDRVDAVRTVFDSLDFEDFRGLKEGVASYFLAIMCYDYFEKDVCPTFKQAQASLRAAWLSYDIHKKFPQENWDYLGQVFYRKAGFFYSQVVDKEQKGLESVANLPSLGPDIDKNFGFDGVLYLSGLLEFKYGQKDDPEKRAKTLTRARSTVGRIVGMGKSSKSKPSAILDLSRDLHKDIKAELEQLGVS